MAAYALNEPAGHMTHVVIEAKVPASHATHALPMPTVPGSQKFNTHVVLFSLRAEKVPAAHVAHAAVAHPVAY